MACAYVPSDAAYLSGMLDYVDCQAQTIGEQGYLALAAPGSVASLILTALLTILIALFGYRMLLGHTPTLGETTLTLVKIGVVVALATGWQGYRTLFYDTALHGPAELAAAIGAPAGLPGASGGLVAQLDGVDQQFQALASMSATRSRPFLPQSQPGPPPLFQGFNTFALGASRVAFLIGAVGAFVAVRLIAGLMLALGPLFIAFLLFDGTRGLFEGWLRALTGAALGALAATMVLGAELAVLGPWLADLIGRVGADASIAGAPAQLLATSLIFDAALIAIVGAAARVAWALRLGSFGLSVADRQLCPPAIGDVTAVAANGRRSRLADDRSRAATVVDALAAAERRETAFAMTGGRASLATGTGGGQVLSSVAAPGTSPTLAGAGGRRTGRRVSASAGRRDNAR